MRGVYAEGRAQLATALTIHPMIHFPKDGFGARGWDKNALSEDRRLLSDSLHCGGSFRGGRLGHEFFIEVCIEEERHGTSAEMLGRSSGMQV